MFLAPTACYSLLNDALTAFTKQKAGSLAFPGACSVSKPCGLNVSLALEQEAHCRGEASAPAWTPRHLEQRERRVGECERDTLRAGH